MSPKENKPAKQWNPPRPGSVPIVEPAAAVYTPSDRELLTEILGELRAIRALMKAHSAI